MAFDIELTGRFLGDGGQRAGFLLLAAFLLSFLFIRTSTRLIRAKVSWWPGNVETKSGLHIHHMVWGILLLLVSGFLAFALQPASPGYEILAVLFGIGAGLTLDEFALWVHLEDVYWTDEGRQSVDAVIVAALIGGLVLAGLAPFDTGDGSSITAIGSIVAINLAFVVLAVLKGRRLLAVAGAFVPLVAIVAAVRLADPDSPWARWRYPEGGRKRERAQARAKRLAARQSHVLDLIGGAPTKEG